MPEVFLETPSSEEPPAEEQTAKKRRTSITLPPQGIAALAELARRRHTTMSDVVQRALGLEALLRKEVEQGGKVLIQKKDKTYREIVFLS